MTRGGVWRPSAPAPLAALHALAAAAPIHLPQAYFDQLANSSGGEGSLGVDPGWIVLWSAEEVIALNRSYCVQELLPGFFGFGSNGAGELLAFDARGPEPYPIVMVPFIPTAAREAVVVAPGFDELRPLMGRPAP